MKPTLMLVPMQSAYQQNETQRKIFWRVFLDWLATTSDDKADQCERAMQPHAHHVRSLIDAVNDAVNAQTEAPDTTPPIPSCLLAALTANGWKPVPSPRSLGAVAA